jgi:hypothetical protein
MAIMPAQDASWFLPEVRGSIPLSMQSARRLREALRLGAEQTTI